MVFWQVLSAPISAVCVAALAYPAIAAGRGRRWAVLAVPTVLVLLTPLLIPSERRFSRFLAMVLAVTMAVKLGDLHIGARLGFLPGWRTYLLSLPNLSMIVLRKRDDEARPDWRHDAARLARFTPGFAAGLLMLIGAFQVDWSQLPFALEHCVKVLAFFLMLVSFTAMSASFLRLLGFRTVEPMDNPFAARTPADFWRRYNRATHQFLLEDVFKPLGGMRFPLRATLLTFAFSAVLHEYVLDVPAGRVQGYQTLFFLIQGIAVAATVRVKPRGPRAIPWIAGTLAFNLATGVLFFASVNELVPFYQRRESLNDAPVRSTPTVPAEQLAWAGVTADRCVGGLPPRSGSVRSQ
jgi:hypothetical protein